MIRLYENHIQKARDLLDRAEAAADTPRALDHLYEVIVAVTRAINELESTRDEK